MVSANSEVVTVPVRPAVAKYLRLTLHLVASDAFQLTKRSEVGRLLYHILRNPQEDKSYTVSPEKYPEQFVVSVSHHRTWLNGCRNLTALGVHDFNRQVEDMIDKEFIARLKTLSEYGVAFETKAEALRFQKLYDFTEEDLALETLIKMYYRYRKAQQVAAARLNLIPNCPAALAA